MEFTSRDVWEEKLARILARYQEREKQAILRMLGDPPRWENIPPSFWDEYEGGLRSEIVPLLEQLFLAAAEEALTDIGIGVDWALVNQRAARWAREYGYELVHGITENTRAALREKIAAAFEEHLNLAQIRESLTPLFGPVRAEMIAITEVTRASVEGERALVAELKEQGIEMIAIWQTSHDELVCPICRPRHNKRYGTNWTDYPPAHPRCRCWVNHEFVD